MYCYLLTILMITTAVLSTAPVPGQQPQVGNGFIATFLGSSTEFVSGLFNGFNTSSHRAQVPATALFVVEGCQVPSSWMVDTRRGLVNATVQCTEGITVTYTYYAHRVLRNLLILEIEATGPSGQSLRILNQNPAANSSADLIVLAQNATMVHYRQATQEEPTEPLTELGISIQIPTADPIPLPFSTMVVTARCLSLEPGVTDVVQCAADHVARAQKMGSVQLKQLHAQAWTDLYEGGMEVEGDDTLQSTLQASLYALLSALRPDWPYSTSPGGLVTSGYGGHTFWDMETWMLPSLNVFYPGFAASALKYRVDRLSGAEVKAKSLGYDGAMFPWESAQTGFEVCPWNIGSLNENHITADIALGAWQRFAVSRNVTQLQQLFPLLNATSNYWVSRGTKNQSDGIWHINHICPPDEYHLGDDSAYTNAAVVAALQATIKAASILQQRIASAVYDMAANLTILYDAKSDYHPEFAQYQGDQVKQADVVLLNYPLGLTMPTSNTARNDLAYYASRTDPNGPAMTWSMFGVGYLSLGDTINGFQYFQRGYVNNSLPPYFQWYEVVGGKGCPNFITGAGGFLQSVWAGLGGVRVSADSITVNPYAALPPSVTKLKLRGLALGGGRITLEYKRYLISLMLTVTLTQQGATDIEANGHLLRVNIPRMFELTNGQVSLTCRSLITS